MKDLQVHTCTSLDIFSTNLSDIIELPDSEAAVALNNRMRAWVRIDELAPMSYVEKGIIARQFETRSLWRQLSDPDTGYPFTSYTAWMHSKYLGCARTKFDAKADVKMLEADISIADLSQIREKENVKTLIGVSTAVRKDPEILAAAKTMPNNALLGKIETKHPLQHIERNKGFHFYVPQSEAEDAEEVLRYAVDHGIAGNWNEAFLRAMQMAREEWFEDE